MLTLIEISKAKAIRQLLDTTAFSNPVRLHIYRLARDCEKELKRRKEKKAIRKEFLALCGIGY